MVGSVGEIFLAIGAVAVLAGLLRWTYGTGKTGALPDPDGDVGLLETVATVPTREAAEVLAAKLAVQKVRVTVSRGPDGWRLLAFPADANEARLALRAL